MAGLCAYCHEDRDGYVQRLPSTGIGKAYIHYHHPINGGWKLELSAGRRSSMEIKINFCPICGRNLGPDGGPIIDEEEAI